MTSDTTWQTLRYALIGIGMFFAGRGKIDSAQVAPLADQAISIVSGGVALATAAWGLWAKFRTATVPASTAARPDVPVVSAATGKVTS